MGFSRTREVSHWPDFAEGWIQGIQIKNRLWFQRFFFPPLLGEDFQFDEHIFRMGWNHEPVMIPSLQKTIDRADRLEVRDSYDMIWIDDTVDGRNPAPVDMVNFPVFAGFIHPRWCRISSINSMNHRNSKERSICAEKQPQLTPTVWLNKGKPQQNDFDSSFGITQKHGDCTRLLGAGFKILEFFTLTWGNDLIWLFFSNGLKPPTSCKICKWSLQSTLGGQPLSGARIRFRGLHFADPVATLEKRLVVQVAGICGVPHIYIYTYIEYLCFYIYM